MQNEQVSYNYNMHGCNMPEFCVSLFEKAFK